MTKDAAEQAFRYFLGELADSEQCALEERFFADAAFSRFLDHAEKQLIDFYVGGKLSPGQRRNFENRFLISERRCLMLRAALVSQAAAGENKKTFSTPARQIYLRQFCEKFFRFPNFAGAAAAFAAVAILIATGFFWRQARLPENDPTALDRKENKISAESQKLSLPPVNESEKTNSFQTRPAKPERAKSAALTSPSGREKSSAVRSPKPKPAPHAFTLLPPVISAEKYLTVSARTDKEKIRLRVVHNNVQDFAKYRVEIHASDGDLVWSREISVTEKTLQKPLALAVRGGALVAGNYELTLSGATDDGQLEEINNYNFTFRKK